MLYNNDASAKYIEKFTTRKWLSTAELQGSDSSIERRFASAVILKNTKFKAFQNAFLAFAPASS